MRKAFTLIELLVVISIIAILIAILLPALGSAQTSAKNMQCKANIKQLSMAITAYATENKHQLMEVYAVSPSSPKDWNWFVALQPYIDDTGYADSSDESSAENIGLCPMATTPENTGTAFYAPGDAFTSWVWQDFAGSYGLNNWLTPDGPMYNFNQPAGSTAGDTTFNNLRDNFFKNYDSVQNPSSTPVLSDCRWVGGWPLEWDYPPNDPRIGRIGHGRGYFMGRFSIDRHSSFTVNASFVDGHAEEVKLPDLWQIEWHRQWDSPAPVTVPQPY
ncbi:MAG: DUF1559 domain-containing protein [Phycisphaeraceae bacterium]